MENPKIFVNRKMENNPFYMAPVEIIIPFHGEQARVAKLMESIFSTVHTNRYLISLVDDGSPNKTFIKQIDGKKLPGVRCFRTDENKGFGAAVNLALTTPWSQKITWVAIIQSDVFAEDNNWLSNLGDTMNLLKGQGVKMVSPMTNNPMTDSEALAGQKSDRRVDSILTKDFLPMYCVLAHRELFNKVGLLKEYPYAGTEVQEFAHRMNKMGYKQAVCGTSWVNHTGGATLANFAENLKAQEILRKVKEEFSPQLQKDLLTE
jgi:GT2 family glycosyltransferase